MTRAERAFEAPHTAATAAFVTGFGQSDSHSEEIDGKPNPHPSAGKPYSTITGKEIARLVREPQSVPKERARWFIPSAYHAHDARSHHVQAAVGLYWFLSLDFDQNDPSVEDVLDALARVLPGTASLIYASRSATADNRKWRGLIPLSEPVAGADYFDTQTALFDAIEEASAGALIPDRALARPGQLVYLPNRGAHYEWRIERGEHLALSPDHPIIVRREATRTKRAAAEAEAKADQERRQRERAARADGFGKPSIVDEFNLRHEIEMLLARYGYKRAGNSHDWRSPYQTSGSYATRVYGERWISLSGSDAGNGIGRASSNGSSCFGDGFDLFVHFDHRGDFNAAVAAFAEEINMDQGGPFAGGPDFDFGARAGAKAEAGSDEKTDDAGPSAGTSGQRSGAGDPEWTEPDARFLRTVLPDPPALPLDDVFSPGWARWIRTAAEAKGAPADYVVAALLSTAGALIGNARWATPWAGWSEVPIIWAMAIGNPSAGKSPGVDAVLTPLKRIEREKRQAADIEHAEWARAAEVARLVTSTWKDEVKAALKSGYNVPEKPREADPGPEPVKPRYALADATVEKVAVIVSAQPRGTLMARDELSGWLGNMSRYSGGSDRPFWLEAYGGRGYNVERMGRESIWIDHLSVGVLGGIQPDKLKSLLIKTDDDGLLARFLPVFPNPAPIKQPEHGIDDAFIDAALRQLLTLDMVTDEAGDRRPWYIPFGASTRALLNSFRQQVRSWEAGQEGLTLSFTGKLPGLAVRLSLILAFLDWSAGGPDVHEISPAHFARAAGFIETYVLPMAGRAYADGCSTKEDRAARRLVAAIRDRKWQRFSSRDALRLEIQGLSLKAELDPVLEALETGDVVRSVPAASGPRGGRRTRDYLVNPRVVSG